MNFTAPSADETVAIGVPLSCSVFTSNCLVVASWGQGIRCHCIGLRFVFSNLQAEEILQGYKQASMFFITGAQLLDLLVCCSYAFPYGENMFFLVWQNSSISSRICVILWIILHSSAEILRSEAWYSLASDFPPTGISVTFNLPPNNSSQKLLFKFLFSIFIPRVPGVQVWNR